MSEAPANYLGKPITTCPMCRQRELALRRKKLATAIRSLLKETPDAP